MFPKLLRYYCCASAGTHTVSTCVPFSLEVSLPLTTKRRIEAFQVPSSHLHTARTRQAALPSASTERNSRAPPPVRSAPVVPIDNGIAHSSRRKFMTGRARSSAATEAVAAACLPPYGFGRQGGMTAGETHHAIEGIFRVERAMLIGGLGPR